MENPIEINGLTITLNEAEVIERFIKSLWFIDEIIILDFLNRAETLALASK